MQSAFDPTTGTWHIGWPGRVARHDLVYLSPPDDPTRGVPLGNGDLGVLLWTEGSRIVLVLNKCDLWDDGRVGQRFRNWAPDEEDYSAALRHAGRIVLDFGLPLCDLFYLTDFQARLSLADATLSLSAKGPLGNLSLRAFVSPCIADDGIADDGIADDGIADDGIADDGVAADGGILCVDVACDLPEAAQLTVTVERYGSRTFGHWYQQINRDPTIGLCGTQALVEGQTACLTQEITDGTFAVGCRVIAAGRPEVTREHARACTIRLPRTARQQFTLLAAVTPPLRDAASATVVALLDRAESRGTRALHAEHAAAWKAFWLRSFMESGDDYSDSLWHLTMYYANASQRGRYPGRFIQGLWAFSRDVQQWTFYFHWNQQQIYWPLNAAGHHDLIEPYLAYRWAGLPHARADAHEVFGVEGAVVSDVADRRGRNSSSEFANHTPVAQIALDFWRQYQYTGDTRFLHERTLPYLLEAARFFESLLERQADGLFHAKEGTGYEGWIKLHDPITELVYARVLFSATLAALDEAGLGGYPGATADGEVEHWREILEHLAPLPTAEPVDCFSQQDGRLLLARGGFKGASAPVPRTLAAGWGVEESRLLTSKVPAEDAPPPFPDAYTALQRLEQNDTVYTSLREDMKVYDGIFPFVEYAAVYPSGMIGLAQQGTELHALAANTARLYAPDCMGWDPLPIVLARLGLRDELAEILRHWPARWQFYPNGFGHYGPRDIQKAEAALRFRTNPVRDVADPGVPRFPFPQWPFRHMGMESMSVLATAINESLLQSHDGIVRIGPAAPRHAARFTLHAVGGFVVSAELRDGAPLWVAIESPRGGACRIANPWPEAHLTCNGQAVATDASHTLRLETTAGQHWLLAPTPDAADWQVIAEDYPPNANAKTCPDSRAQLGLPRMF
ncbi:MAG: glycosyl hydrolase family 95 catalytic domain-containing protein [Anaerolineae bacterium]